MAKKENAIFTVLCMVYDDNGNILVEDRIDPSWQGVCLPGGHVEPGESITLAAIRETREETGLTIENPQLCGVKQFMYDENTRYVVFLYKANRYSGTVTSSDEGKVFWVHRNDLINYQLVPDFLELLKVFDNDALNEFCYRQDHDNWIVELF